MNYVVCINNKGYEASLENRKIYLVDNGSNTAPDGYISIIDESGESYFFEKEIFKPIEISKELELLFLAS